VHLTKEIDGAVHLSPKETDRLLFSRPSSVVDAQCVSTQGGDGSWVCGLARPCFVLTTPGS
jgi:hypothetical protein